MIEVVGLWVLVFAYGFVDLFLSGKPLFPELKGTSRKGSLALLKTLNTPR